MKKTEEVTVLSEKEIRQKLAGYKANYNRELNKATGNERKSKEDARDQFFANIEKKIREENQHNKMVRAGHLSWETRRANMNKKCRVASTDTPCSKKDTGTKTTTTKRQKGSKVGIRVIHK